MVREDVGEMVIDLTVTLKNELSEPARVSFTIEEIRSNGRNGRARCGLQSDLQ